MKDNEIKKLFGDLRIVEPAMSFEDRIIAKALTLKPAKTVQPNYFARGAAVAAMLLFVVSFTQINHTQSSAERQYASLVDDNSIVSEDDVYDELVLVNN